MIREPPTFFFLGSRWTFRCAWQPVLQRTFHCWQLWKMRKRRKEKWKRRSNPFAGELFTFKCSQTKGEQTFFAALTSRQRDSQQLLLRSWWREAYALHGEFCLPYAFVSFFSYTSGRRHLLLKRLLINDVQRNGTGLAHFLWLYQILFIWKVLSGAKCCKSLRPAKISAADNFLLC